MSEPLRRCPHCGPGTTIDVNSIQLECLSCGLHGPVTAGQGEDCTAAIAAWNSLPRHLCWTTETPTEPGYYWVRLGRIPGSQKIAQFYLDCGVWRATTFNGDRALARYKDEFDEWAGPILEPQEPQ